MLLQEVAMTHLVHVGNSLGVRIPKALIAQAGFKENMELTFKVTDEGLLIAPVRNSREGWEEAFKASRKGQKEPLLLGETVNTFDQDEWEW